MAKVSPSAAGQGSSTSVGRQSLKFNDQAKTIEELVGAYNSEFGAGIVNEEIKFMKHIYRKECHCFIEKPDQDPTVPEDERACQCNYTFRQHSKTAQDRAQKGIKWNPEQHTIAHPTNAFGEIEFVGYGDHVAKYVRVAVDTKMETMLQLLTQAWNMEKPNLLISVTGGAKNFSMKTRLREVFRRGLMKAALSTGAWIVTGGSNAGVMKHVGEAVRDFGLTAEGRVMTIGIASWGAVQNKEHLIAPESFKTLKLLPYGTLDTLEVNTVNFLTPDAVAVPVCLLVLEGGPGSLETVYSALSSGTPTVVIKGSGKTADILAYAYQNVTEQEIKAADQQGVITEKTTFLEPQVRTQIEEMIKLHFGDRNLTTRVGWVEECCKNLDLLSVFELDSQNSAKDVDLAILKALLKDSTELLVTHIVIKKQARQKQASQELFVWAVLMNHHKLSKLFWNESRESSVAGALFANNILMAMKRHTQDSMLARKLQTSADDYRQMSVGVLNACYSADERRTHLLLVREMKAWGATTCIRLAVHAGNKQFVAQSACQTLFNSVWYGRMEQDNSLMAIILCTVVFPLIPVLIRFTTEKVKKKIKVTAATKEDHKTKQEALSRQTTFMQAPLSRQPTVIQGMGETTPETHNWHQDDERVKIKKPSLGMWKKMKLFYTSPIVKFILNVYSYTVFLLLYSYILVVYLSDNFHFLEGVLAAWVFTIFLEEIRQFVESYASNILSKLTSYLHDTWNILDITTILLFLLGMILRLSSSASSQLLDAARVILSINLITFFSRILHIFSISKQLGPKLSMIYQMIQDLMWFVAILLVFIISYAVASEAVLYPESELSWKLLFYLPRKAYWHIYGELFLEDIEGENQCTNDPALYNNYSMLRCPSEVGKYFVPILLGLYILMTNVLLLNLLIAMFSYTFQRIQANTDMHWCFQRFNLVHEYMARPVLPPPFIIVSHIYLVVTRILRCCRDKGSGDNGNGLGQHSLRRKMKDKHEEKQLVQWENIIADNYMNSSDKAERSSVAGRVKASMEKLEEVMVKVEELQENQMALGSGHLGKTTSAVDDKISQLESQLSIFCGKDMRVLDQLKRERQVFNLEKDEDEQKHIKHDEQVVNNANLIPLARVHFTTRPAQLMNTTRALDWIMQALQENKLGAKKPKPVLPDFQKQQEEEEQQKRLQKERTQQLVKDLLEKKIETHYKSRRSPYFCSPNIQRFSVPDEKVLWEIEFPEYNPPIFTSLDVQQQPSWADEDLLSLTPDVRKGRLPFNKEDPACGVSRISFIKEYEVEDGLPVNPVGRTGLRGRGLLGRWGPNHAADPVVTRWKMLEGDKCAEEDGKPVLEFIAVRRRDNNSWALPGRVCAPSVDPVDVLKMEVIEEQDCEELLSELTEVTQVARNNAKEIYRGYADDPRNTDNAWLETRVVNYHIDNHKLIEHISMRASDEVKSVTWQTVSSSLPLHGSHSIFLKWVADAHNAAF
ncbi:transient receptor potential cation channel subfamily M member 2-like [Elysia marginata]|uniref:Transient receptor potential cation channel subfamily M member 2-like n=1 Tax=Elysia marginata TaxID=1093978 RepID=A0AAV4FVL1_9GAST|nr:transient receptor potential cation channel subfamily M member 2-like [Elysia marginata]